MMLTVASKNETLPVLTAKPKQYGSLLCCGCHEPSRAVDDAGDPPQSSFGCMLVCHLRQRVKLLAHGDRCIVSQLLCNHNHLNLRCAPAVRSSSLFVDRRCERCEIR